MKNKKTALFKACIATLAVLLSAPLFIGLILIVAYLCVYNTVGLPLYYENEIKDYYVTGIDEVYLVDQDGRGYMVGNYNRFRDISDKKYSCVEDLWNEELHMPPPVLFYEEGVKEIFAKDDLFVSQKGELFFIHAWDDLRKIADSAIYACGNKDGGFYVVDEAHSLWFYADESSDPVWVTEGVKMVQSHRGNLYILRDNGDFCEISPSGETLIMRDVEFFSVINSEYYYDTAEGTYVYDRESADVPPLLCVLTEGDELWIKGILAPPYSGYSGGAPKKYFEKWTLLHSGVSQFEASSVGVAAVTQDGQGRYWGFASAIDAPDDFSMQYTETMLQVEYPVCVRLSECVLLCHAEDGTVYVWGMCYHTCMREGHEHLYDPRLCLEASPIVIKTKNEE